MGGDPRQTWSNKKGRKCNYLGNIVEEKNSSLHRKWEGILGRLGQIKKAELSDNSQRTLPFFRSPRSDDLSS